MIFLFLIPLVFGFDDGLVDHYIKRYELSDVYQKRVDNRGIGDERLYGTRNFRVVLSGILYRGGANNYYHRDHPRDNANPLPEDGLLNLCQEGFSKSIYLYSTRYSNASPVTKCYSEITGKNKFEYEMTSPMSKAGQVTIIKKIYKTILNGNGPIFVHCWNGWHASGLISAIALRQFCGLTSDEAVSYWDKNTDGQNRSPYYEKVRQMIRDYEIDSAQLITKREQAKICPAY